MNKWHRIPVELGSRSYDIHLGSGVLAEAGALLSDCLPSRRAVIITDRNLAATPFLGRLEAALREGGLEVRTIALSPGEATKSFLQLQELLDQLLEGGLERRTAIIAFGGGVIGDLAGFAAAIALRGLPFVQIPTTLLAQVDSSVGGKTGINSRHGKNLIGAFYQPKTVLIDIDVLKHLPAREIKAGYAEVVKYGFLHDREFFEWLEHNGRDVLDGNAEARLHAVSRSVEIKAEIVKADETEQSDLRALLNFGHTFGHAFERLTGYSGALLHGEAVSLGMVKAFTLSRNLGYCSTQDAERACRHLRTVEMPVSVREHLGLKLEADALVRAMQSDKKVIDGKLRFILAHEIGRAFVADTVDEAAVLAVLDDDG